MKVEMVMRTIVMRIIPRVLISALLFLLPVVGQSPSNAALLKQAEALRSSLSTWQATLNRMNLVASPVPGYPIPSLDEKRSFCLLSITTAGSDIPRPGTLPAISTQMALLTDLASLDNALANLIHAFELIRALRSPSVPASVVVEQEQQVERIRKQLQSYYEALLSTTFPHLAAVDRMGASEHASVSHQSGQISGHIYNAESGNPLAGVVVTLESLQAPARDQVQRTGRDGSYNFGDLAAGKHWVIAYRKGFAGSIYGMHASQNALESAITVGPGEKLENADFRLSPLPSITPMNDDAALAALPLDTPPRVYGPGRFSPDGTQFAVAVRAPESNYVCVYSVAAHHIDFVASAPEQSNLSFSISDFTWVGDSLYAEAVRSTGAYSPLKVTRSGIQRLDVSPGCESVPLGQPCIRGQGSPGPPPVPPEVQNTYFRQLAWSLGVAANSRFIVTADNSRSLDVWLVSQSGNGHDPRVIARGGDNLKAFLLEAGPSLVLYPMPGLYFGGIVAYNLNSQRSQTVDLAFVQDLRLLDSISDAAGTLVAYKVDGPCVPPDSASGEDPWLLPGKPVPVSRASNVCFVEVPHNTAN
jgi:5-hydroxyisourate hydrolase-like protein (transthyretin family)